MMVRQPGSKGLLAAASSNTLQAPTKLAAELLRRQAALSATGSVVVAQPLQLLLAQPQQTLSQAQRCQQQHSRLRYSA